MTALTLPVHDPTNTVPRGPSAISLAFPTLSANTVTWNPAGTTHWLGVCARRRPEADRPGMRTMHESAVMTEGFEIIDRASSAGSRAVETIKAVRLRRS